VPSKIIITGIVPSINGCIRYFGCSGGFLTVKIGGFNVKVKVKINGFGYSVGGGGYGYKSLILKEIRACAEAHMYHT
jgi:hypothetical protein